MFYVCTQCHKCNYVPRLGLESSEFGVWTSRVTAKRRDGRCRLTVYTFPTGLLYLAALVCAPLVSCGHCLWVRRATV